MNPAELKLIKESIGKIASSDEASQDSCCSTTGAVAHSAISTFNESYDQSDGYVPDADLSLGCKSEDYAISGMVTIRSWQRCRVRLLVARALRRW